MQAYRVLQGFMNKIGLTLPLQPISVTLFIAYLQTQYSCSTVVTYISALSFFHKLHGYPDPTQHFLVIKSLAGLKKISLKIDIRLPITLDILYCLVQNLDKMSLHVYDKCMYQAMFCLAFFGFLRVSEFTSCSGSSHSITFDNVSISPQFIAITMHSFKHSKSSTIITIPPHTSNPVICPISNLSIYVAKRGHLPGPLFIHRCQKPVTRSQFTKVLVSTLNLSNLDSSRYKGHSFRIGAATFYMQQGWSDAQIRKQGRWNSNAFQAYIRP